VKLNLGCGRDIKEGWVNVDVCDGDGINIVADLNEAAAFMGVLQADTVDEFLMSHVIEHLRNPLITMQELHRIAKPNARITIRCPHGASDDADEDPTHVRRMFPGSFGYFSQPYYWRADYGYRGDWELDEVHLWVHPHVYDTGLDAVEFKRNAVREIVAVMHAVKPIRPAVRTLQKYVHPTYHCASY
jgi:SAM-dependent methyltransferase